MRLLLKSCLACVLAVACSTRKPPPPGADGATIYRLQNCANCHGERGEGKSLGPALDNLGRNWSQADLAGFFADPKPYLGRDARLEKLRKDYPAAMSRYDNLDESQRSTLAAWLLSR